MSGVLYVVGTPIGNLEDISARALRVLGEVDVVLAEDTRRSRALLSHFGISARLRSLHQHNENAQTAALLELLERGQSIALVSDAGMPLIADPGFPLLRAVREAALAVEVVPGPCALVAALAVAGLPAERFVFEGFLPARSAARRQRLAELAGQPRTLVFYESPHRLAASLDDVATTLGAQRQVRLARELTKRHESLHAGTAAELAAWAAEPGPDRQGEFVVLVAGSEVVDEAPALDADALLKELVALVPPRAAAKIAARLGAGKANALYRRACELGR